MKGPKVGLYISLRGFIVLMTVCEFVLILLFSVSDEVSSFTCYIRSVLTRRVDLRALLRILKGMLYRGVFYRRAVLHCLVEARVVAQPSISM